MGILNRKAAAVLFASLLFLPGFKWPDQTMRANNGQIIERGVHRAQVLEWQGKPDRKDPGVNT